jgi:hypothetical protein
MTRAASKMVRLASCEAVREMENIATNYWRDGLRIPWSVSGDTGPRNRKACGILCPLLITTHTGCSLNPSQVVHSDYGYVRRDFVLGRKMTRHFGEYLCLSKLIFLIKCLPTQHACMRLRFTWLTYKNVRAVGV